MTNTHNGYLVNEFQASVAVDKMARIHHLVDGQPFDCHIDEIKSGKIFETIADAEDYCRNNKISFKHCAHCF